MRNGDLVQFYIKQRHEKRGSWAHPKIVPFFDADSLTVAVPGSKKQAMNAAFQDVRHPFVDGTLASSVHEAHCQLSVHMEDTFDYFILMTTDKQPDSLNAADADSDLREEEDEAVDAFPFPFLGMKISVSWLDDNLYYPGTVFEIAGCDPAKFHNDSDDSKKEVLNFQIEIWKSFSDSTLYAHITVLCSNKAANPCFYFELFQRKRIILFRAQGTPQ